MSCSKRLFLWCTPSFLSFTSIWAGVVFGFGVLAGVVVGCWLFTCWVVVVGCLDWAGVGLVVGLWLLVLVTLFLVWVVVFLATVVFGWISLVVVRVGDFDMVGCCGLWLLGLRMGRLLGGGGGWWLWLYLVRNGSIGLVVGGLPLVGQWSVFVCC